MNRITMRSLAFWGRYFAILVASLVAPSTGFGQQFVLTHTFDNPTPQSRDYFGGSFGTAIDGYRILVSAASDDTQGENVGQVYLFDAVTGELLHTYDDPTPSNRDSFGGHIAIEDNRILVSAWGDDTYGENVGQAHLFDAETGELLQTFNPPQPSPVWRFGSDLGLEGDRALVSAFHANTGVAGGEAYLYDVVSGDLLRTFYDPNPAPKVAFAYQLALDGNRALFSSVDEFGVSGAFLGEVHLFDAETGTLLQTFSRPAQPTRDVFGGAIAIDGEHVLVGAPAAPGIDSHGLAYLFDATNGDLLTIFEDPTPTQDDYFGSFVEVDGGRALIGAPLDRSNGTNPNVTGQMHLFDISTGELLYTFDNPFPGGPSGNEWFGTEGALDGRRVLIGVGRDDTHGTNVGQAYLFTELPPIPGDYDWNGDVDGTDFLA